MKIQTDKILEIILVLALISVTAEGIYIYDHWPKGDVIHSVQNNKVAENLPTEITPTEQNLPIPEEINLNIPFTVQAPLGDWSYPFNHTCEEAAILMAHYYLAEKTSINPAAAKGELLDLVDYETKHYGFHEDTSAEQTAQLIRDYYGYNVKVSYNVSLEDIKKELAQGNPVIVPTAGRLLGNPYFTPPGPIYHMLVIKGYNADGFVTNDPGTRMGADYLYPYQTLMEALHDWNGGDVENGTPAMISIEK